MNSDPLSVSILRIINGMLRNRYRNVRHVPSCPLFHIARLFVHSVRSSVTVNVRTNSPAYGLRSAALFLRQCGNAHYHRSFISALALLYSV